MGVSETIHGQRLQALGLEARLKREQHEQRRQVVREQMIPAMQVVDERRGWQVAAHAHEIEALQLGLACDDKALPSDDRFDIRACPGDYRVALIGPVVSAETTKHRFDIGSRRVAQRAGDEGAISIARGRAARGSGQRSEEHTSELQSLMRISYAVFCLKKKKTNTNT